MLRLAFMLAVIAVFNPGYSDQLLNSSEFLKLTEKRKSELDLVSKVIQQKLNGFAINANSEESIVKLYKECMKLYSYLKSKQEQYSKLATPREKQIKVLKMEQIRLIIEDLNEKALALPILDKPLG